MGFGSTKSRRTQAARKHADRKHTCSRCGRVVYGNGYYNHKRACHGIKRIEILVWECAACGKNNMSATVSGKLICGYCKRVYVKHKGEWDDELMLKADQGR